MIKCLGIFAAPGDLAAIRDEMCRDAPEDVMPMIYSAARKAGLPETGAGYGMIVETGEFIGLVDE